MQTLQSFRATLRFVDFLERRKEVPHAIEVFQPFQILPIDVQQKIFSYLDISSILRCMALDKCTNRIIDSVEFWNSLISRDQESWNIFGNGSFVRRTITESFFNLKLRLLGGRIDEPTQAEKLKNFYLQHQMELLPSESRLLSTLDMNSAPPVIPMFGEAGSGYGFAKKVLYNMMWTENSSLPLTTLVPGVQGVGSGVAFKIDGRVMAYSAVSKTNERNIFECMNEPGPWRDFYHNAGGLILVVNSSISLEVSAQELRAHLAHTQPNAPLLVLSVDPGLGNPVPGACQIAKALNLQELERPWRVRSCSLKDCTGIYEGLVWLKRSFLR